MEKRELESLCKEGLGEYEHFITLDGRMVIGDKIGEKTFRREKPTDMIDFSEGTPANATALHIKRLEKTEKGVFYYTLSYYTNLRDYKVQSR